MRGIYLLVGALIFLTLLAPAEARLTQSGIAGGSAKSVYLAFFGTAGCHDCDNKWNMITELEDNYPNLVAMRFDFIAEENKSLFENLCDQYGVPTKDYLKTVFIGDDYLQEEKITETNTRALIEKYSETGTEPPWTYVYVAFFGSHACATCKEEWNMITKLKGNYSNLIPVMFDYLNTDYVKLEQSLLDLYNVNVSAPCRAIFIGDYYLLANDITEENLRPLVKNYLDAGKGTVPPWKMVRSGKASRELPSLLVIIAGGLADGINPCAFAVVVFFVSYLEYLGRRRREIALVGGSFILAVFLTYLLVGTGILLFMRQLEAYPTVSPAVKVGVASLAIVLGLVSIYDYYLFKKEGARAMKLQLPVAFKRMIHTIIRKTRTTAFIVPFAFAAGFIVSLFELGCTGQVYLPIITLMSEPTLRVQAVLYLILYNIMFMLPLLVVFGLVSFGVRSQKLDDFAHRHTGKVKLIIAAVLFALAAVVLTQVWA